MTSIAGLSKVHLPECSEEQKKQVQELIICLIAAPNLDTYADGLMNGVNGYKFEDEKSVGFYEFLKLLMYGTTKYLKKTRNWKISIVATGRTFKNKIVFNNGSVLSSPYLDELIESFDIVSRDFYQMKYHRFGNHLVKRLKSCPTNTKYYGVDREKIYYSFDKILDRLTMRDKEYFFEMKIPTHDSSRMCAREERKNRKIREIYDETVSKLGKLEDRLIKLIDGNPKMKIIRVILDDYKMWKKSKRLYGPDFYYHGFEHSGDWGVDDSYSSTCETWDDAREQMGTTCEKFSLNKYDLLHHELCEIGRFLTGTINVIVCLYDSWRLGYDYKIINFTEYDSNLTKAHDYFHLCLT